MTPRTATRPVVQLVEGQSTVADLSFLHHRRQDTLDRLQHFLGIDSQGTPAATVLTAGRTVGVVETDELRVEVRPWIARDVLGALVRYAFGGRARTGDRARTGAAAGAGLEDALAELLCEEAARILGEGLSCRYEERIEPLEVLRGRPLWLQSFPWPGEAPTRIVCRRRELTLDTLDNQILLAALRRAAALSAASATTATRLRAILAGVARERPLAPVDLERAMQASNRLTEHYRVARGVAGFFLFGRRPDRWFASQRVEGPGLSVDMAFLFEAFVERFLREALAPDGVIVQPQAADRLALLDGDRTPYRSIRPDLELRCGGQAVAVVDAKYKPCWRARQGVPERRLSNGDLYQLFFYQQRLQRREQLARPPGAFAAVPLPDTDERAGAAVVDERYQRVTWRAGSEPEATVHLLLVPVTRFLRAWGTARGEPATLLREAGPAAKALLACVAAAKGAPAAAAW